MNCCVFRSDSTGTVSAAGPSPLAPTLGPAVFVVRGPEAYGRMLTMADEDDADAAIDGLYALDPGEFVAARTALAKRLKADGRKDAAAAVARLRRPSVVAGAINRAVRQHPDDVEAAIDAASRVVVAQADLMAGGEPGSLRSASTAQRAATAVVVRHAVAFAGATHTDAVRTTVDAALADPDLTEHLRAGTLTDTLAAPAGFGFGFDADAGPAAPRRRRSAAAGSPRTGTSRPPRLRSVPDPEPEPEDPDAELRAELDRRSAALDAAAAAQRTAEEALAEATTERDEAEEALASARARVRTAEAGNAAAGEAADAARAERDRLEELVEDLRRQLGEGADGPPRSRRRR